MQLFFMLAGALMELATLQPDEAVERAVRARLIGHEVRELVT